LLLIFVGAFMPQHFFGHLLRLTEWRRTGIPTFGDGKLMGGWLFFKQEIAFVPKEPFLALSRGFS
jgi:hypothetical protein